MDKTDKPDFSSLRDKWPSPIVARDAVKDFSGGTLNSRSMANLDCKGLGPKGRFRIGRKIAYTVDALIEHMTERATYKRLPRLEKKCCNQ